MSLEKSSITWSAKQLKGMIMNGKINFDHIVQRSYVWERSRKSCFIESMILGYPIPLVYAKKVSDGTGNRGSNTYYIMDGKQRLSTIKQFLNDEFALTELAPVTYMDDELGCECETDISGMKFSELPEALRDYINTTTLSVTHFENLTKEEERELFKRLNAGKPLSTKSRLLASCKDIEGLLDIGSHKLFSSVDGMLTEKARDNKNQVAIVMKCWCMMNQDINDVSFESKLFNPLLESAEINEAEKLALIEVFNLIFDTHFNLIERKAKKVAKKLFTETHMVSLIPYFKKAIEAGIGEELMADWLVDFFTTEGATSVSEEYNVAAGSGSAKNHNIIARHDALMDSFNSFFECKDEDVNIDDSVDELEVEFDTEETDLVDTECENIVEDKVSEVSFVDDLMSDMESEI